MKSKLFIIFHHEDPTKIVGAVNHTSAKQALEAAKADFPAPMVQAYDELDPYMQRQADKAFG